MYKAPVKYGFYNYVLYFCKTLCNTLPDFKHLRYLFYNTPLLSCHGHLSWTPVTDTCYRLSIMDTYLEHLLPWTLVMDTSSPVTDTYCHGYLLSWTPVMDTSSPVTDTYCHGHLSWTPTFSILEYPILLLQDTCPYTHLGVPI